MSSFIDGFHIVFRTFYSFINGYKVLICCFGLTICHAEVMLRTVGKPFFHMVSFMGKDELIS